LFVEAAAAIFLQVLWQNMFLASSQFLGSSSYKDFATARCLWNRYDHTCIVL